MYSQPEDYGPQMPVAGQEGSDRWFQSELWQALEKILDDPTADAKLAKFDLWIANSSSMKLTFYDQNDAISIEHLFEALVCRYLQKIKPKQHTYELYSQIDQARMLLHANLRRSVGADMGKLNERTAIGLQMRLDMAQPMGQQKKGFFKRLMG